MKAEVILPDIGAAPVTVSLWFAEAGETVFEGDRLVEMLVDGATFDISAPATGRLATRLVKPAEIVRPGQVLGIVEVEEDS